MRTTRLLGTALAVLSVLILAAGCTSGSNASSSNNGGEYRFVQAQPKGEIIPKKDRMSAPNVTGELLDGTKFSLASEKGKIVVLNFWATWCAPCRVESPELQKVYETYKPQGLEMIGVLVRDSKEQGVIFNKQYGLTYPSIYDPKTEVALQLRNFPLATIPSTIVFDRSGKVAAAYVSVVDQKSLTNTIDELLTEQ